MASPRTTAIDLYWLPLGAGGNSVRLNGRIFEWFAARLAHRDRCDLYHSALEVEIGPHGPADTGHYRMLRDGKPLRKANGMPFMLLFSPDTIRWRSAAIGELRRLGIDL